MIMIIIIIIIIVVIIITTCIYTQDMMENFRKKRKP